MKALALAALMLVPLAASAHGLSHPRRLELDVDGHRLALKIELELSEEESHQVRELFDRDRDGELDGPELELVGRYLALKAAGGFQLTCGGTKVDFDFEKPIVRQANRAELAVELDGTGAMKSGECVVEDGGDAQGHAPLVIRGAKVSTDAARSVGPAVPAWDVPARTPVRFQLEPPGR